MTARDPVSAAPGGTYLLVDVVPGAKADAFPAGTNVWRAGVQARVAAPPEDGQANEALVHLVAGYFQIPATRVRVVSGHRTRHKRLLLEGVSPDEVRRALPTV